LGIGEDAVGIKAKTNEGMGEVGAKEAISVFCTALIKSKGA
jgi:2C-methyl-D-erythritol 2,4-cyclodiphosphate synthase